MLFAAASLAVAGCASKTGVVPIGDGMYMVSMADYSLNYSGGKVKAELYQEATEFCAKQNKKLIPITDSSRDAAYASHYASAEVKFSCE